MLCADSRKDMEEWISAIKTAASRDYYEVSVYVDVVSCACILRVYI